MKWMNRTLRLYGHGMIVYEDDFVKRMRMTRTGLREGVSDDHQYNLTRVNDYWKESGRQELEVAEMKCLNRESRRCLCHGHPPWRKFSCGERVLGV